jgi:BirA family transcriptional regulator, biotin operon repressor / biotin---[acetyl-CoA-carboxylase] ligase
LSEPSFHQPIGTPFIELQTVDSTNNYAFSRIHAGLAQHGLVIFAHEQTAGKGQRGKKWASSKGVNIALSIIIKPAPLTVAHQFQLSACAAVAIHEFFRKYAGVDTRIKWPNDLYWKDRKAGGILIESVVRSQKPGPDSYRDRIGEPGVNNWLWAVIGIGININQTSFPTELPNPVSLKQITGKSFDTVELAKEICRLFNDHFEQLITHGFEEIYTQYVSRLYKINEKVKLKKDNLVFETTLKGVSPIGKLIVQHGVEEDPITIGFDFGEIAWVI